MRLTLFRESQRGDTIIEVLFAVTVFAMVAVGSLSIMNQGTATAQRALEITLVRQQIDAQAEAIRFIHQSYISAYQSGSPAPTTGVAAEWNEMTVERGATKASPFGQTGIEQCPATVPGERPFILNARQAKVSTSEPSMSPPPGASLPPFSQVIYDDTGLVISNTYGLWIEAIPSTSADGPGFVDFHIRACWSAAGSSAPATLGTIVRLYEPR
jgi:type II secretory pathway pseudopilin PulG